MAVPQTGYINGSDILLSIGGKAVGHCTTHTITFNSETKDRAVKPAADQSYSAGLWKGKGVTGLSISISAEGLRFYGESENVAVLAYEREGDASPYLSGNFIITSIEETSPAQDDATYTVNLESDGEPTTYPGKASAGG